ncbi:MAG: aminoglycoside phosphotransferase family protein [Catenulispora sp.]|nr:aminoglycoside phosphotransferase family protein [Catenulispora sp.]
MAQNQPTDTRPVVDAALARQLVDSQFPQWASLPLTPVVPGGSDHAIYRLGPDLTVRLPRHAGAMRQARKEATWLPRLAPALPLDVPVPEAVGAPDFGYPWYWAVHRWTPGETATVEGLGDSIECAETLAGFLTALQSLPTAEALTDPDCHPADDLVTRDAATRENIARTTHTFDAPALTELWDAALSTTPWPHAPRWFHGDFHTGNLLTRRGALSAVLDFGSLAIADPSRDLMIAFTLLNAEPRKAFRSALAVDEATWTRGRAWALTTGLNAYVAYAAEKPWVKAATTRQIIEALAG